jgi:hypothetical protein
MTSDTYQETIVSHELANLFQQILFQTIFYKTRQEIHITKKKMQISDVCASSKVSTGKKNGQKEDKTFKLCWACLLTQGKEGYLLCLDSLYRV